MSCSLWRWTEKCDRIPCVGDCDLCDENLDDDTDAQMPQEAVYKPISRTKAKVVGNYVVRK